MMAAFYFCERWMQKKTVVNFTLYLLIWALALFSDWYFGLFVGIYYGLRIVVELIHHKNDFRVTQIGYAFFLPAIILGGLVVWYFQQPTENLPYPVVVDDVGIMYSSFWSLSLFHFIMPVWMFSMLPQFANTGAEFALHPGLLQFCLGMFGLLCWKQLPTSKTSKIFLLFLILTFAFISLGPLLKINNNVQTFLGYPVPMPAMIFELIPGLTSMRVFTRFIFVAWLGMSLVGLLWLQEVVIPNIKKEWVLILLGVIVVLFLVETQWKPLTVVDYEVPAEIVNLSIQGNVLELPINPTRLSGMHLYHQTIHHQPIYAIEISRISTYRKAYLEQFPFLVQISDIVNETNPAEERINTIRDRFCDEIRRLDVGTIMIAQTDMGDAWVQRKQDEMDAWMNMCEQVNESHEK
jgi:hypothetical protein